MANLFYGINIAKNALDAQSSVLNIAAHNMANANTPGFSRQKVQLVQISDWTTGRMSTGLAIGSGVEAKMVYRSRFALYDQIFRKVNQDLNFNIKTESLLHQVEILFDEPSDRSLGGIINNFFNGWLDIANAPQDMASRQSLYSTAQELIDRIQRINTSLVIMREDIDTEISAIPKEINAISSEIARLNVTIRKSETQGGTANDLRDKRDLLIDKLSEFVNVRAIEQENGTTTILVGSKVVVEHESFSKLSSKTTVAGESGMKKTAIISEDGTEYFPQDGKLGALINVRDVILLDLMKDLDKLTEAIVTTINYEHRDGYGLDGVKGRDFFKPNKIKAFNIEISNEMEDVTHIGVSGDGSKGDNSYAYKINELNNKRVVDDNFSINEFYNGMIANLGVMAREVKSGRINEELLFNQIDNSRESIKGVNIDEELVFMMQAQRIYQSAARLIVVMDDMLEEIINLL